MPPGTIIVDESWTCGGPMRKFINFDEPRTFFRLRDGGGFGWGIPASLGVKLAMPDRKVVAVIGDGGAIFSIQSLWMAAHYNIPVTFIICANASYGTVKLGKIIKMGESAQGRFSGMNLDNPKFDFVQLAQSLGVKGLRVEKPDDMKEAFISAIESNKPELIEVVIEDVD